MPLYSLGVLATNSCIFSLYCRRLGEFEKLATSSTDKNFDGRILEGLRARLALLDIVRVQDTAMYQSPDPALLTWLADEGRILLTHDVSTMPRYVQERVQTGQPVPGVVAVHRHTPLGQAIDELEIIIGAGAPEDFANQVTYIPIR